MAREVSCEGAEANASSTSVNVSRVLDRERIKLAIAIPVELSPVELASALETPNAILEHGDLDRIHLCSGSRLQKCQAPTLENRMPYRVLKDKPRSVSGLLAYQRPARPAVSIEHLGQAGCVVIVDRLHARMIPVKE
jgi:hypothetical protein